VRAELGKATDSSYPESVREVMLADGPRVLYVFCMLRLADMLLSPLWLSDEDECLSWLHRLHEIWRKRLAVPMLSFASSLTELPFVLDLHLTSGEGGRASTGDKATSALHAMNAAFASRAQADVLEQL